jgi:hypothetical protein
MYLDTVVVDGAGTLFRGVPSDVVEFLECWHGDGRSLEGVDVILGQTGLASSAVDYVLDVRAWWKESFSQISRRRTCAQCGKRRKCAKVSEDCVGVVWETVACFKCAVGQGFGWRNK